MPSLRNLTVFLRLPDARPVDVVDREIAEELSFHIAMRTRDNVARGMTAEQAEQDARRQDMCSAGKTRTRHDLRILAQFEEIWKF